MGRDPSGRVSEGKANAFIKWIALNKPNIEMLLNTQGPSASLPDHPAYYPPKGKPPKNKIKNPNGPGRGWEADDGGVWVWNPNAHRSTEGDWVAQYPGGGHKHPSKDGGLIDHSVPIIEYEPFVHPFYNVGVTYAPGDIDLEVFGKTFIAAAIFAGIGVLIADDISIIGVADDFLIPILIYMLQVVTQQPSLAGA